MKNENSEASDGEYLKSRIAQQSELICILKRKTDDFYERFNRDEKLVAQLEAKNSEMKTKHCKTEQMLKKRFDQLSENYDELVIIKDELKKKNEDLLSKNSKLLKENGEIFSVKLKQKSDKIIELEQSLRKKEEAQCYKEATRKESIINHEAVIKELEASMSTMKQENKSIISKSRRNSEQLFEKIKDLELGTNTFKSNESRIVEENDRLANAVIKFKEETKTLKQTIQTLQKQVEKETTLRKLAQEGCKKLQNDLSSNCHISYLTERLDTLQEEYNKLSKEYDTFKIYSRSLIEKERVLNASLRRLQLK